MDHEAHIHEAETDNLDFDDSANALWSLYGQEAKNLDHATIKDIKSDMDGLLIFVRSYSSNLPLLLTYYINGLIHPKAGLFSAALTAFIIDRNQTIQPSPVQQSAFYQQQSVALLNQISQQLSSLGAQPPALSNSSMPGFTITPSTSDVRVNIIWIIGLVFSLSASLLATLIQQWARDHMYIFERYGHPLRIARIRQYRHEGTKDWRTRAVVELVPGLVHISLFLFLIGLSDYLLNTYAIVGKFTLFPITFYATIYIICTFAPVVSPQCPYRTPFSRLAWYISRKLWRRLCKNRFGLDPELLSSNLEEGQMQLAMEKNEARKGRDERAIRWLVNSLAHDIEVEPLASGIPGSFNATWGVEVWKNDPAIRKDELYKRIGRLLETCNDRGSFMNEDEWRKRSRACVETVASFVFCMDADINVFGDVGKLLSDLGSAERTREVSEASSNKSFVIRWTCLSLVATRQMLNSPQLQRHANGTLLKLGALHPENNFSPSEMALRNAQRIDERFAETWGWVERLRRELNGLGEGDTTSGRIEEIIDQYEPELVPIRDQIVHMERLGMDVSISELQKRIDDVTYNLTRQLPGVAFDHLTGITPVEDVFDLFVKPVRPQLVYLSQLLLGLCAVSRKRSSRGYRDTIRVLQAVEKIPPSLRVALPRHRLMERQLWRLQDLSLGGAFGFTLELYFLSFRQVLSTFTSPPKEIHKTFYVNTFKSITDDWKKYTDSIGTIQIILNLVYDIAIQDRGIFSNFAYPDYITEELLDLLGRMVDGQENAYIDDAMVELWPVDRIVRDRGFRESALMAILGHAPYWWS